jgi:hypothetical protein
MNSLMYVFGAHRLAFLPKSQNPSRQRYRLMSEVWRDLIFAALFAMSFAFNLWAGKTHLFPWATCDRDHEYRGFRMAQGLLAPAATAGIAFGAVAAVTH